MTEFSSFSGGPSVDSLGLKLSGTTALPEDLKRGDEVEIIVRGVVRNHIFEDKVNAQTGDVEHTIKFSKVVIDELDSVTVLRYKRRNAPTGQTAFADDGSTVDASTGTELVPAGPHDDDEEPVDAEVVGELEAGEPPEGVDPKTGEVTAEHEDDSEPQPDDVEDDGSPIRHPRIPEEAWDELNHGQRSEVNATVERLERFIEAVSLAENPTDRNAYNEKAAELAAELKDQYGVELLDADAVHEADEDVLAEDEPPPPPIGPKTGPRSVEQLVKRRVYLLAKRGLGREASAARADELEEIERRLRAQGAAA